MSSPIFLIGPPGAGKTYWAQRWAEAAGWQWVDTDARVEAETGLSVDDIFNLQGEQQFRSLEGAVIRSLTEGDAQNTIVSCGAGAAVWLDNLDRMLAAGCVVYLQAEPALLATRLEGAQTGRPLLKIYGGEEGLAELIRVREPLYEKAHITIAAADCAANTFAQILERCTNRQSQ